MNLELRTPEEVELVGRLLDEARNMRATTDVAAGLLARYEAAREAHDIRESKRGEEAHEAAGVLWPLLLQAEREGSYVRCAYADLTADPHGRYVTLPAPTPVPGFPWSAAVEHLRGQGRHVQMVVRSRQHERGVNVEGYRIPPDGADPEAAVELADVYREGGHCVRCGIAPGEAQRDYCRIPAGHTFPGGVPA